MDETKRLLIAYVQSSHVGRCDSLKAPGVSGEHSDWSTCYDSRPSVLNDVPDEDFFSSSLP